MYILNFREICAADLPVVGGKGANLGEMARAGFPVPPGFCLTTAAFGRFIAQAGADWLYGRLDQVQADDLETVRQIGQEIRDRLQQMAVPGDVAAAVLATWRGQGEQHAYAVRSSATAEDLPGASFAGQQDTYLNVCGQAALLEAVRNCWASLFTDRAILYRLQNGFAHRDVQLAVVVQRMVLPDISGILFTADPVTNHRGLATIDASYGLGEALVAGLVSADLYKVDKRRWEVVEVQVRDKQLAVRPVPGGGTVQEEVPGDLRQTRVLPDEQAVALAQMGARIEQHYGRPQDIEWAIEDEAITILQTRPITSLFPLPEPRPEDDALHVYASFNHAQVMTDPMPPMAHSIWRTLFPFGKIPPDGYSSVMLPAAGRLYIDITSLLHNPHIGRRIPQVFTVGDPLIADGLQQIIGRAEFKERAAKPVKTRAIARFMLPVLLRIGALLWLRRPEGGVPAVSALIGRIEQAARAQLAAAAPGLPRLQTGQQLLDRVFLGWVGHLIPYIATGVMARVLLARLTRGCADPADLASIQRGLSGNVTTEMDLQVGDLADVARQSPSVAAWLLAQDGGPAALPGGPEFWQAWQRFLQTYGMRCPGEIDISRPRWRDDPRSLLQVIRGNLQTGEMGGHRRHHQQLAAEGLAAGERLVQVARRGFLGPIRARLVQRLVRVARGYLPVREHPKFLFIRLLGHIREIIVETADSLVAAGRLDHRDDVWYLELPELIQALENPAEELRPRIRQRQAEMARYRRLRPPRVITSDGEIPAVGYAGRDVPAGALPGSPVSAGVVEGLAHVVHDPTQEILAKGEILVAPFTDPGWTPLFINAAGLVMEVGGLMTHGSVVAREYGIPAVVGVVEATSHIHTGQRIRVHGDKGYVELLKEG
ncbi:MAG: phosphoenolpyruvate synthase [Chloroflexi bacterium]|nr:phosphoenolpyruvate synthase [Chloroflexota bacterium]MCI0578132.1 phosphoenolpyruvate synthase [Chloroflexota bacterium]MCI0649624.1 phosphoenolpyruvate synthase [Chloroflexota bacterium]MCI0727915.1 phosphoenolpyruvate synthase [Chloroflexota bacterium]